MEPACFCGCLICVDHQLASGASRLEVSSNVPFPQDALFVDRKDIMADLEAKISNPLHHQRVALVGLGGMG